MSIILYVRYRTHTHTHTHTHKTYAGFLDWLRPTSTIYPNPKCDSSSLLTEGICGTSPNLPGQSLTGICRLTFPDDGRLPFMTPSSFYRCLNLWINSDLHADMLLHKLPLVEPEAPFGSRRLLFADGSGFDPADHRGGATGESLLLFLR